jgi:dTDP-4-dehydrorhamnose reductase
VRHRVAEFAGALEPGQRGVLINAAEFANMERAETQAERAYLVNQHGPVLLARAAREAGLGFVHVSTAYVFDGEKDVPYAETDEPNPLSVYATTKLAGETSAAEEYPELLIVRTGWLYGTGGANIPADILGAARTHPVLSAAPDEAGCPTYSIDLAAGILALAQTGAHGVYHLAGSGWTTRFGLAVEVLKFAQATALVQPVNADELPQGAPRPLNSVLDCSRAAEQGVELPQWREALVRYLAEIGELVGE